MRTRINREGGKRFQISAGVLAALVGAGTMLSSPAAAETKNIDLDNDGYQESIAGRSGPPGRYGAAFVLSDNDRNNSHETLLIDSDGNGEEDAMYFNQDGVGASDSGAVDTNRDGEMDVLLVNLDPNYLNLSPFAIDTNGDGIWESAPVGYLVAVPALASADALRNWSVTPAPSTGSPNVNSPQGQQAILDIQQRLQDSMIASAKPWLE